MHLIIGGAYQGKLNYAKETLKIDPEQICDLRTDIPSPEKNCYYHISFIYFFFSFFYSDFLYFIFCFSNSRSINYTKRNILYSYEIF